MEKIPVGISSCLLGEEVRFDGGHRRDNYIKLTLGQFFEFKGFCPEVESGMGVPRPPVQLRETEQGVRCVDIRDHNVDVTENLVLCAEQQYEWLQGLCGYILKRNSPSCGMEKVNVFIVDSPKRIGTGIFAQYLKDHFPLLPVEEEGRLGNPQLRENFIQRVFVMHRWHILRKQPLSALKLTEFHKQHQLIAMSHDQDMAQMPGRIAASADNNNVEQVADEYIKALMACLKINAKTHVHE